MPAGTAVAQNKENQTQEGIQIKYCQPGQKPMAQEVTGPKEEPTAVLIRDMSNCLLNMLISID